MRINLIHPYDVYEILSNSVEKYSTVGVLVEPIKYTEGIFEHERDILSVDGNLYAVTTTAPFKPENDFRAGL